MTSVLLARYLVSRERKTLRPVLAPEATPLMPFNDVLDPTEDAVEPLNASVGRLRHHAQVSGEPLDLARQRPDLALDQLQHDLGARGRPLEAQQRRHDCHGEDHGAEHQHGLGHRRHRREVWQRSPGQSNETWKSSRIH